MGGTEGASAAAGSLRAPVSISLRCPEVFGLPVGLRTPAEPSEGWWRERWPSPVLSVGDRCAGLALPGLLPDPLGGCVPGTGALLGLGQGVSVSAEKRPEGRPCASEVCLRRCGVLRGGLRNAFFPALCYRVGVRAAHALLPARGLWGSTAAAVLEKRVWARALVQLVETQAVFGTLLLKLAKNASLPLVVHFHSWPLPYLCQAVQFYVGGVSAEHSGELC